jgi:hypothetical protein
MFHRRKIAIGAVSTAAVGALCLGMTGPAIASESRSSANAASTSSSSHKHDTLTFVQMKSRARSFVEYWQKYIAAVTKVVAASGTFTDAQKLEYATKAARAEQTLADLRAAIIAAKTPDELRTAVRHGWAEFQWPRLGLTHAQSEHVNARLFLLKAPKSVSFVKVHPIAFNAAYKVRHHKHVELEAHHS